MSTRISGSEFQSKVAFTEAMRAILHRYPLRGRVSDDGDAAMVGAAFESHPAYAEKVAGRILSHFEVHPNKGGSRCFYAVFTDCSMIDFSFMKATMRR